MSQSKVPSRLDVSGVNARRSLCYMLYLLHLWKRYREIRAASADRIKHITTRSLHQIRVTATHLSPAPRTGVYVPKCKRRIAERALFVCVEKTHCSILLQERDQDEAHRRTGKIDTYLMAVASFTN
jgi:hypothetical protein